MRATIKLNTNKITSNGHPVIFYFINGTERKKITLGFHFTKEQWNFGTEMPIPAAPDFNFIHPRLVVLKYAVKQLLTAGETDFLKYEAIFINKTAPKPVDFYTFTDSLIKRLEYRGQFGNAKMYKTAITQLKKVFKTLTFAEIDYENLTEFIHQKIKNGAKNSTIHAYLRTFRAIYNEAVLMKLTPDKEPFKNAFKDVLVRKNRSKKKYLHIDSIRRLELMDFDLLTPTTEFFADLFLLQFYFGGQDLIDIYYLQKKQIKNNRVYFSRLKLGQRGYEFDLAIDKKAAQILKKYAGEGENVIPGRKDFSGYQTFRRRYQRYLVQLQDDLGINVLPLNTNLGVKVARYTFANRGKLLGIDEDMLREIMGHERNEVDTIYKDRYPQKMRDEAHLKIVDTAN